MKKMIFAAAAVSMLSAPAFAADNDSKDFDINARVTPECSMENPSNINLGSLSINRAPGEKALLLTNPAPSEAQTMFISCNTKAQFSVNTLYRGLKTDAPVTDTAQFTNLIRYGIKLTPDRVTNFAGLGSYKPRVQTPGPIASEAQPTGEFHANYSLQVMFDDPDAFKKRPVAGSYTDTVTFSVAAI
ncbi:hypothetical protein [Qipengyuania oceanensis]|uniref:Fimbrial protein n=1 Tax=Qipengyuania oceanensis TaxID=1463597 RepID=A0A844YHR6_9SPHN|nr:hypothetical protein [Qipengyuania oceanensis]MXO63442.1 hypothetical protein [Qipengyuania oceanensis]